MLCPRDLPDKNTGVGCHFFLQGIDPNTEIEPESPVSLPLAGRFFTTEPPGEETLTSIILDHSILVLEKACGSHHPVSLVHRWEGEALRGHDHHSRVILTSAVMPG